MISVVHFHSLAHIDGLQHAITTRAGGVSHGPYESLNLGYHVGDDAADVTTNRRCVAHALGYDAEQLIAAQQVHGAQCRIVDKNERGLGALSWGTALPNCDAIIVQAAQVPVLIQVADCAPILLVDSAHHVLAVVHAGWRGAVARIVSNTIATMKNTFGVAPHTLFAGIGPCLCANCFEIGPEVADEVATIAPHAVQHREPKPHLDLRALLCEDLQSSGVPHSQIEVLPQCPRCDNETFFSHRGQQGNAGRFGLVAYWNR
jgi:hypothetical protein